MRIKEFIEQLQKLEELVSKNEGQTLPMADKLALAEQAMKLFLEDASLVLNSVTDRIETIIEKESIDPEIPATEEPVIEDPEPPSDPQEPVPTKEELNDEYPNRTALRTLKEHEIVSLGKLLGIEGVDLKLKSSENDDIVIKWFELNIWN